MSPLPWYMIHDTWVSWLYGLLCHGLTPLPGYHCYHHFYSQGPVHWRYTNNWWMITIPLLVSNCVIRCIILNSSIEKSRRMEKLQQAEKHKQKSNCCCWRGGDDWKLCEIYFWINALCWWQKQKGKLGFLLKSGNWRTNWTIWLKNKINTVDKLRHIQCNVCYKNMRDTKHSISYYSTPY